MLGLRILAVIGVVAFLSAAPKAANFTYSASPAEIAKPPGTLLSYQAIVLPSMFRGKAWRILYATRDYLNRPILSSGVVLVSAYANKSPDKRPIVAWAHPTIGIARKCAPSLTHSPINTILGLNEFVSAGYIVAATDYPGLGTSGPIGYMVGKGQANAVIDSVRAAKQIPAVGGGNEYALFGYSQGAHAAIFASLFNASYAPELKLIGMAAVAPPTQLGPLIKRDLHRLEGRVLASYVIGSWTRKYGLTNDGLIDPTIRAAITAINDKCLNSLSDQLDVLSAQKPLAQHFLLRSPMDLPEWRSAISANSVSSLSAALPSIIFQGGSDTIVDPKETAKVV